MAYDVSGRESVSGRLAPLDGLRGVAALIVIVYHFIMAFLPWLTPEESARPPWIADTPVGILFNGPFAVLVFFVLSGFVVAQSASKRRDPIYVNVPLRYVRLAVPAAASVAFAWCLLMLIPDAAAQLNAILPHEFLGDSYQGSIPGLGRVFYEGFIGIFTSGTSHFDSPLWTMRTELWGSIMVYALYALPPGRTRVSVWTIVFFATFLKSHYLGFMLGCLLRELWAAKKLYRFSPLIVFGLGIILGAPGTGFAQRLGLPHLPHVLTPGALGSWIAPVAAAMILYAVLTSERIAKMFASPIPQFLGRISFPLYLVHVPLIFTLFAFLYVYWQSVPHIILIPGLFASFLVVSFSVAYLGERFVDRPVLRGIAALRARLRAGVRVSGSTPRAPKLDSP